MGLAGPNVCLYCHDDTVTHQTATNPFRDFHALSGDPDRVIETAREYEKAGVDLLLCLVNPYDISHEHCMQTIELMGKHVIPEFG